MDLKVTVEGLEKERDFYFGKLRNIEVMCQEYDGEELAILQKILDVLYATEVSNPRYESIRVFYYRPIRGAGISAAFFSVLLLSGSE